MTATRWNLCREVRDFNSHPHEEDDDTEYVIAAPEAYFNSHPHEEDDHFRYRTDSICDISTHILTKRMTADRRVEMGIADNFNSHPHEEDDQMDIKELVRHVLFQLTSSRRG
mgnify:CR=1 FL=1